jgi:hypothetical protein
MTFSRDNKKRSNNMKMIIGILSLLISMPSFSSNSRIRNEKNCTQFDQTKSGIPITIYYNVELDEECSNKNGPSELKCELLNVDLGPQKDICFKYDLVKDEKTKNGLTIKEIPLPRLIFDTVDCLVAPIPNFRKATISCLNYHNPTHGNGNIGNLNIRDTDTPNTYTPNTNSDSVK